MQRKLERLAENELSATTAERVEAAARMERLADALASPEPTFQGFSRIFGAQLSRLKTKDQILAGRQQLQETRLRSERAKAERLEERAGEAHGLEKRAAEEETLFDLIDRMKGGDSSLR